MNARILVMGLIVAGAVAAVVVHRRGGPVAPAETTSGHMTATASNGLSDEPMVDEPAGSVAKKLLLPATTQAATKGIRRPKPLVIAKKVIAANVAQTVAPDAAPVHPAVPMARAALSFVGIDEDAEVVWAMTINDPSVPAEARKDLIEDLNEDGFPDPKNVTADDLPLILSRMELIEEMAPDSMDETNAAAFMEAYKGLVAMLAKAVR